MGHSWATQRNLAALSFGMLSSLSLLESQTTAAADPLPYGPDTCIQGFVWRAANPADRVCVTPAVRDRTAQENAQATRQVDDTCAKGYVWREAFEGDHVCVTPEIRTEAANDNAAAASRMAANQPTATSTPNPGLPLPPIPLPPLPGI